jgi:hypothetical protein
MDNQSISIATVITGIKDGAYQQAKVRGVTRSIVESLMAYIPGLGDPRLPIPSLTKSEKSFGQAICNVGLRQTSQSSLLQLMATGSRSQKKKAWRSRLRSLPLTFTQPSLIPSKPSGRSRVSNPASTS